MFTCVDIGACGRRSDGGVYSSSGFGQKFDNKEMNLPDAHPLSPGGIDVPYVMVGDEAFPLKNYIMRPYPGRGGLCEERKIYNYRLSRARQTIESSFGIVTNQWAILKGTIVGTVDKCITIVQAILCLHNFLCKADIGIDQYIGDYMLDVNRKGPIESDLTHP